MAKKSVRLWGPSSGQWTKAGVRFAKLTQRAMEKIAATAKRRGYDLIDAEVIAQHSLSLGFTITRLRKMVTHFEMRDAGIRKRRRS